MPVRFSGYTYRGLLGDTTTPLPGITLEFWIYHLCDASSPGVLWDTRTSDASGFWSFPIAMPPLQPPLYDRFRVIAKNPPGLGADGAVAPEGVALDANTLEWCHSQPRVYDGAFFFAASTPTSTLTPTPTLPPPPPLPLRPQRPIRRRQRHGYGHSDRDQHATTARHSNAHPHADHHHSVADGHSDPQQYTLGNRDRYASADAHADGDRRIGDGDATNTPSPTPIDTPTSTFTPTPTPTLTPTPALTFAGRVIDTGGRAINGYGYVQVWGSTSPTTLGAWLQNLVTASDGSFAWTAPSNGSFTYYHLTCNLTNDGSPTSSLRRRRGRAAR